VAAVIDGGDGRRILIDTPPELRLQLLSADVGTVDAVLFTHDHADHVHGIDDLRAISQRNGELPLYGPQDTLDRIVRRFDYIFDRAVVAPEGTYKPDLSTSPLNAGEPVQIAGIDVLPIELSHGVMTVFGYRFGPFAYLTDVKSVPDDALASLSGVRVLVINALFDRPHPTHLSIPEAVALAERVGAEQTYLTHLTHRYRHRDLSERLPEGVEPAYDGLTLNF
jgi:phosphoribosyl 1,2-cyclic phosphate phosphodiesterase